MLDENLISGLADRARSVLESSKKQRILITIAGPPGAGKSLVAEAVASSLNMHMTGQPIATVVGMDGFHLTRRQLQQQPDSLRALARRGAPFTFNAASAVDFARRVCVYGEDQWCPSFDHAIKDPIPNNIFVPADSRIILFEGNYLHLDYKPWNTIAELADDRWLVEVDRDTASSRLAHRHMASGICKTLEEGFKQADSNDLINLEHILLHSLPANIYFSSDAHSFRKRGKAG